MRGCQKCAQLKAEVKDLKADLRELKQEFELVQKGYEVIKGLQDCGYCEKEMYPNHYDGCHSLFMKKDEQQEEEFFDVRKYTGRFVGPAKQPKRLSDEFIQQIQASLE